MPRIPLITELPYFRDSSQLFEVIADRPWAVFLDSAYPMIQRGRYDILCADPMIVLVTRGPLTEIRTPRTSEYSPDDPFELLRRYLIPTAESIPAVPFCGGAIGYFSYDLGRRLECLPSLAANDEQLPDMAVGIYDWALVVDHLQRRSWMVWQGRDVTSPSRWRLLIQQFCSPQTRVCRSPFQVRGKYCSNMTHEQYASAYRRIERYIREGDCYQVNLAQRFEIPVQGDSWLAYRTLRRLSPAPFSAYLHTPYAQILSMSPERFLRVVGGKVETQPIKGTAARNTDPVRDHQLAEALTQSGKDRAENLMIVDLLRNDLSRNCALGSVEVSKLFELQSFAIVHHLVSTVTGRLAQGRDALHLLRGCFPGGSITGAPKLRAMEIIEELEPHRRGIYSGSIGYIGFDGSMDLNIAIRTAVRSLGRLRFWAGGGIVADSTLESEYQECVTKAATVLKFLQSFTAGTHKA